MNRSELARAVADRAGAEITVVERTLTALDEELIQRAGAHDPITWPGLFTLDVVDRPGRTARNPQTGEPIDIPARPQVRLRPGARLKRAPRTDA